jgi:molecular chaperone HscB
MVDFSKNYFELFGMPVGFRVDKTALAERYRDLQKVVHPDRFASGSEAEQRLSLQQTTQLNEAHATLKDPVKRAIYLLKLNGVDMALEKETTQDTAFLMEQLELREQLSEAKHQADPVAVLDELMGRVDAMIKALVAQLAMQFETATEEQLEAARESVRKMQFLNKLHAEAQALEEELEENY